MTSVRRVQRGRHRAAPGGRHRAPRSFRRAVHGPVMLLVSFATSVALGNLMVHSGALEVVGLESAETTGSADSVGARLLEQHDCWTGRAPAQYAGSLPAGAVVVPAGADRPTHGAEWVGPALRHVYEGAHPRLTVLGFCAR